MGSGLETVFKANLVHPPVGKEIILPLQVKPLMYRILIRFFPASLLKLSAVALPQTVFIFHLTFNSSTVSMLTIKQNCPNLHFTQYFMSYNYFFFIIILLLYGSLRD